MSDKAIQRVFWSMIIIGLLLFFNTAFHLYVTAN